MPSTICEPEFAVASRLRIRPQQNWYPVLALALLCCLLFFFRLADRDLSSSHEARAGQDAQTVLSSGKWDLPRLFDGRIEMQKPPLYYWLVALLGAVNGGQVNEWCVRLPSALSALGCVLLLLLWGVRRGRPLAAHLAAVLLATSLHFTALARIGRIDMPLTFTVSLTLVGFVEGIGQRQAGRCGWPWFLLAYLATAAGVMLKGPIAIALPVAVGLGWCFLTLVHTAWNRERLPSLTLRAQLPPRRVSHIFWGVPLVLLLTLPWFLCANYQTDGEFFRVFFWHHNIDRGLGTDDTLRAYPWWYYGPQMMIDLLPWSLALPVAAWWLWRHPDRDARFGALWFVAMLVLLSCMRFKRADYLVPAFPGVAWMLGCVGERWYRQRNALRFASRLNVGFAAVVGTVAVLWLGYVTIVIPTIEENRTHRRFAEEIRRRTSERVIFFWAEAHLLAFQLGQPQTSFVEWDRLDAWVGLPHSTYLVMPADCLAESPKYLKQGTLEAVIHSTDLAAPVSQRPALIRLAGKVGLDTHERSYVLVRTHCNPPPAEKTE
jgi:4-amino-4-deoxy-L-arabinose transferase-like glycosyltransferase